MSIITVFQLLGGAVFISIAENIFSNQLLQAVPRLTTSGVDPSMVLNTGASSIATRFEPGDVPGIIESYMVGLKAAWILGIALAAAAAVASFSPDRTYIGTRKKALSTP